MLLLWCATTAKLNQSGPWLCVWVCVHSLRLLSTSFPRSGHPGVCFMLSSSVSEPGGVDGQVEFCVAESRRVPVCLAWSNALWLAWMVRQAVAPLACACSDTWGCLRASSLWCLFGFYVVCFFQLLFVKAFFKGSCRVKVIMWVWRGVYVCRGSM